MRILVTGGLGFIGSHLSERLRDAGHEVTVLDSLETGRLNNLDQTPINEKINFIQGSVLDEEILDEIIREVDYVFHLAAAVGVLTIMEKTLQSIKINVWGTENVLRVATKYGTPVFLTSSSEIYGKNTANSLTEDADRVIGSPLISRWSYSEAKAITESLAFAYFQEKNLETRIVRFFNTVGPRQIGNYGMVIPRFIDSAMKNESVVIYGSGEQTRCFAHIYDVIDAILEVAFVKNTIGKVVNIGNDEEISINDLALKIISRAGSRSEILHIPYSEAYGHGFEDMERRVPNLDLIQELVGWRPKRNLDQIIDDSISEFRLKLK